MLDKDYDGKTVLMHAASSGRAAVFKQLFIVMNEHIEEKKVSQHLTRCRDTIYRSNFLCCTSRFVYMSSNGTCLTPALLGERFHFHLSRPTPHDKP